METKLPEGPVGSQWEKASQLSPSGGVQASFDWNKHDQMRSDQRHLLTVFAAMVRVAGGTQALTKGLNREDSYESKVCDAINGEKNRKVQLEWMAPLLSDPRAQEILAGWICERCGFEPPVRARRSIAPEDFARAARELISEMKDDEERELVRRRLARKLGVRVEDVPL